MPTPENEPASEPAGGKGTGESAALVHRALKKAVKDRLLTVNPAVDLERQRPTTDTSQAAREHC